MRDIKFRAWDIKKSEISNGEDSWFLDDSPLNSLFKNDNFIFQQFTGLKDKNGQEIYEGDIVRVNPTISNESGIKAVEWEDLSARFNITSLDFLDFENNEGEIIGNIYENPELLTN